MRKKLIYLILTTIIIVFNQRISESCTNFIVTKGASVDGSVMISYNADAGGFMERLYFSPAADYKAGESLEVYDWDSHKYLGKIAQVAHTYHVVGLINEYQVSIGETTFGGRPELRDTNGKIDYGSLMQIALQRAKTAREAIKVMTDLVAEYGYYSSGESFSIADANEAWIMDMIGRGPNQKGAIWVAVRIPDGYVAAHANRPRIREFNMKDPENCIYSKDLEDFLIKNKLYKKEDGPIRFADIIDPVSPSSLLFCEGRVWSLFRAAAPSQNFSDDYWRAVKGAEPYPLFIKPDKKISVKDVIDFMRDHFDGTDYDLLKGFASGPFGCPVRWKGLTWKLEGDSVSEYAWERPISSQQSAFTMVSQMRSWLPRQIGGIHWYGVDDNYTNVYMPLYCCITRPPKTFSIASIKDFSLESAFWVFNLTANLAYTKYDYIIKDIQKVQSELENKYFAMQPAVEAAAIELNKTNPDMMVDYLTDYSNMQAQNMVDRWRDLWTYLVTKYNDGYINDVNVDFGRHPKGVGYGNEFLKNSVKDRPEYYEVKWRDKKDGDALKGGQSGNQSK